MATKREATVKFRADTTDYQKQITEANSKNTMFRSGVRLLDTQMQSEGATVDLLTQKQELLTQQLDQTRIKTNALEAKLNLAREVFGENSVEVDRLTTQLNNARSAEQKIAAQIDQANQAINQQAQAEREANSALSVLTAEINDQQAKVNRLTNEYKSAVIEFGATSNEAKQLQTRLSSANNELSQSKAKMSEAENAANALANDVNKVGVEANASSGELLDMAKNAAGVALAAAGVADVAEYMSQSSSASAKLKAAIGESEYAAEAFDEALLRIYQNGYGESFSEIADAGARVAQVLGNDISPASLQAVTTSAMVLSDTFDIDIAGSTKAAQVMMNNFGIDAESAFDLLARGAQEGLNINEDMVDSFAEYSPYFAQIGLDANDMFNAFASGADISMYGVDKAGDAFKEFGIRVVDGSETTKQAFSAMSLSADDYASRIMAGGESAKTATGEIIDALLAIEDPVQRNITGVSLFGTQWEDLGQDGAEAMLSLMGAAVDAEGALEDVNSVRYDDIDTSVKKVGRTFETEFFQPLTNLIEPAVAGFSDFFISNFDLFAPIIIGIAIAFGVLAGAMAISGLVNGLTAAFALLNGTMLMSPITWIVALIAGLVAAIVYLASTNEEFTAKWGAAWSGVVSKLQEAWNFISPLIEALRSIVVDHFFNQVLAVADFVMNTLYSIISSVLGLIEGAFKLVTGIISGDWSLAWSGIQQIASSALNGIWGLVTGIFGFITSTISNAISFIVNTVSAGLGFVDSIFGTNLQGAFNTVVSIFSGIVSAISGALDTAKSVVSGAIEAIKNFFSFNISWPHIPMPHFVISPSGWKIGDLLKGSIPSISIDFWAKGGIMTQPTIFGFNGNRAQIGGEAGYEAILPITTLQTYIDAAFDRNMRDALQLEAINRSIQDLDDGLGRKIADNAPDSYPGDRAFRSALRKAGVKV